MLVGSTVEFPNSDTVRHNVYSPAESTKQFNLGVYPPKSTKDMKLEKVGVIPLLCNVHSEMSGYIAVLPNPYFAVTDKKGKFTIEGVPAGSYELTFWHEKLTPKTQAVSVTAGSAAEVTFSSLKRGDKYSVKLD